MSVGISQVNFDAQALEDEDEEALEKEDQEREQEIRELLNRELGDGLLDDDNASFSSHDLRSSGYSRDTPFSEEYSDQPYPSHGSNVEKNAPSEDDVFERLPLMTQRGVQLISRSRQNTDSLDPEGRTQVHHKLYGYHHSHYQGQFDSQGYYDQQTDLQRDVDTHQDNGSNYRSSPEEDYGLDEGFDTQYQLYTGNEPREVEGHSRQVAHPYHHQSLTSNEQNDDFNTYGYSDGYTDEHTNGILHHTHQEGTDGSSGHHVYRIDTPSNYRVQYRGHQGTFSHLGQRGFSEGNQYGEETSEIKGDQLENENKTAQSVAQLQILYKARGRKLEELTRNMEIQEEEMSKQIRVLNHQNALLKDERDGFSTSLQQSQKMIQGCHTEINSLKGQLAATAQQVDALKTSKDEAQSKLQVAETTVDSLNQQLVEISRSESLARAKEQHESVVNAIKKKHGEEVLTLKQKLDEAVLARDWKTEEANRLREELVEKAEMINSLTRSLDSSQKQCQELLKTGTMSEINQLRLALQESSTARNIVEGQCITLKHELSELQEQVKMYESATRLGVSVGSAAQHSNSFAHLTVRNLNNENWSTPKSHIVPMEETITELRKELDHCLTINKNKRSEVHELKNEVNSLKDGLRDQEAKSFRMEQIAQEHEKRAKDLETKLQSLEDEKKDPDEEYRKALQELELTKKNLEESTRNLAESIKEKEEVSEICAELKQQMAQMVDDFDEDKRISLEKCREACLQLHEEAKKVLREQLDKEHQDIVQSLRNEIEDKNEELIRIKECYVQLSEESRGIEENLREQFEKEKLSLLSQKESELVGEIRLSLEKDYTTQLEAAREEWKKIETKRFDDELERLKEQIQKEMEQDKLRAVEEAVSSTLGEKQSEVTDQIAAARKEWLKDHEDELERRLSNAIGEVRRIWDEEQKLKTEEEIEKARKALERAHEESRDQDLNRAVELALSHAHSDWLRNDEEMRQREIDQAVEVAITNAVAEAKEQWEKEVKAQDNVLQACLSKERLRLKREEESERSRAVEAAVAIAEVKWLEDEQRKITEAVEQAMQTARDTWQEEKERDIAMAVEEARHEWSLQKDEDVNCAFESAGSRLVEQFEEQKRSAVKKALNEARSQWDENRGLGIESLRQEVLREFEEQKKVELQETLEEAREAWNEEADKQKQAEINEAITYLESQYAKGLEEFKHKELRIALEQARKKWVTEKQSCIEDLVQTRVTAAHKEWREEQAHSTQVEVDRALSTAREAWAANYDNEMEERISEAERRLREKLQADFEDEKNKLVEETLNQARTEFENEKRRLEEELRRHKEEGSTQTSWHLERERLLKEHETQLQRVRDEQESKVKDSCAYIEAEMNARTDKLLKQARSDWDKEQHDTRVKREKETEQRTKQILYEAREEWRRQPQKEAVVKASEQAVRRQQELWANERMEKQSALEKVKNELATLKREHAVSLDALKNELLQEKNKAQHSLKRQDSRDYATQTTINVDSGSDTSFSSVDHVTATRGLQELRQHYLDTIAKIRDDVLDHVNQTKSSASKKIRSEVLRERHSTAKKLRRYYLQCLKQLLEEDRLALEANVLPSSAEDKLERMAFALKTPSPSKESTGQPPPPPAEVGTAHYDALGALHSYSEPDIRESRLLPTTKSGRPRDFGPDGASDSPRCSGKERGFTPILGDLIAKDGFKGCHSPDRRRFVPERESEDLSSPNSDKDLPKTIQTYTVSVPCALSNNTQKRATNSAVEVFQQQRSIPPLSADKELQQTHARPTRPEHALKQKPLAAHKRSAPSPALSVTSCESEQYSELPTVIHIPKRDSSGTTREHLSDVVMTTSSPSRTPVRDMRTRPRAENRVTKLMSRGKPTNSTAGLPSKPRVHVSGNLATNRASRS